MFKKNSLVLRKITGTFIWKLERDFVAKGIRVPKGFETNLASSPKFLYGIFPNSGVYTEASVLHDYMYSNYDNVSHITKKEADNTYLLFCTQLGVGRIRAKLMHTALNLFGSDYYRNDKNI